MLSLDVTIAKLISHASKMFENVWVFGHGKGSLTPYQRPKMSHYSQPVSTKIGNASEFQNPGAGPESVRHIAGIPMPSS